MSAQIIEKELSFEIVAVAYRVYNTLGPGFLESIYEHAMAIGLKKNGMVLERQKPVDIFFDGHKVGHHVLDLIVNQRVILELKAAAEIATVHKQQALSYL